jgi:hypothetical protein
MHNRFFTLRWSKQEFIFFIYTRQYKYGITWDDIYGFDYGRAAN